MRSCLARKIFPVITVICAACGGSPFGDDTGFFNDDPTGVPFGVVCAKGAFIRWQDRVSYDPIGVDASWAAIKRENQVWQTIDPTQATVALNPGEKIELARWVIGPGPHSGSYAEIFFLTAEQAQTAFPCVSWDMKSVHGTAQGLEDAALPGNQGGYITIGNASTWISNGPFTLDGLSPGHTDLVATRLDAPPTTIIRRGVDYPNGYGLSLLNFGSGEAIWLQPHTVTVNGANINQFEAKSEIVTQRGTVGLLSRDFAREGSNIRAVTLYSVPEGRLTNDEVQFFVVDPEDGRKALVFFRHPADRSVTLGPDPATATATHSGTAPNLSLRLDMPSQPEYGAQVTLTLCGPGPASYYSPGTSASVVLTKEYFGGTPPTWTVTVPDLTSVPGYPGGDIRTYTLCTVGGLTNLPFAFAPRTTHDGEVFTSMAWGANVVNN